MAELESVTEEILRNSDMFTRTVGPDGSIEWLLNDTPYSFVQKRHAFFAHMDGSAFTHIVFDGLKVISHKTGIYFMLYAHGYLIGVLHK